MKTTLWIILVSAMTAAPLAMATSPRIETEYYTLAVSNLVAPCGALTPTSSQTCFTIVEGEVQVELHLVEHSATRLLGQHIAGRTTFIGGTSAHTQFCDEVTIEIPAGATQLIVEVQTGQKGNFCSSGTDTSPAVYGLVEATFT